MKIPKMVRQRWVKKTLWTEEKREGRAFSISEARMDNLLVVEEERKTHGRGILAR